MAGLTSLEEIIAGGIIDIVGDPFLAGLLVLVFFGGFVFLQGTRLDAKVAILIPAVLLAFAVFPSFMMVPFLLVISFVLYLAVTKFLGR